MTHRDFHKNRQGWRPLWDDYCGVLIHFSLFHFCFIFVSWWLPRLRLPLLSVQHCMASISQVNWTNMAIFFLFPGVTLKSFLALRCQKILDVEYLVCMPLVFDISLGYFKFFVAHLCSLFPVLFFKQSKDLRCVFFVFVVCLLCTSV